MNNRKIRLINVSLVVIGIITLVFSIGFILGYFTDKIAFPIMFTCLGLIQLLQGLFIRKSKFVILIGILFVAFAFLVVIPTYYF